MPEQTSVFTCVRCQRDANPVRGTTYPGALGDELRQKVCADCWAEWQHAEVMVINELRLNFMDPRSQEVLIKHMREFLCLDGPPSGPPPGKPREQP
jgi:Fe-S cluster biosynthesis and repair protein YggX